MPSIGVDVKTGRGWGLSNQAGLHAVSLGCICFWWLGNTTVVDQLTADQLALAAARDAIQAERDRLKGASVLYRTADGRFHSVSKSGQ